MSCKLCERVKSILQNRSPELVHEFANSILIVGDHQFFSGYCVLIQKDHHREMHEMSKADQLQLCEDLMLSAQAIAQEFKPWKMNQASLGNQDPHVHWHLFPRYENDPNHRNHPWTDSNRFNELKTTEQLATQVAERLRKHFHLSV